MRTVFMTQLLILSAFAASAFGQTLDYPVESTSFGIQSYTSSQTARVSVGIRTSAAIRDIVPCVKVRIVIEVFAQDPVNRAKMTVIRTFEQELTLDPGEATTVNVPGTRLGDAARITVYSLRAFETDTVESVKGAANATVQVVESGRPIFTLPGTIRAFNPQPDPPAEIDQ